MESIRRSYLGMDEVLDYQLSERAVCEFPNSPEFLAINAHQLAWHGQRDKAAAAISRALEFGPECAIAWAASAQLGALEARFDDALESAGKALALDDTDPLVLQWSIDAYSACGDTEKALSLTSRWCELQPDELAFGERVTVLFAAGRTEESDSALAEMERRFPESPRVLLRRARVLMRATRLGEATVLLRKATEVCPNSHMAWAELASALSFARKDEEAEVAAKRALNIGPCALVAMQTMSRICRERGDEIEAAEWHRRAREAIPVFALQTSLNMVNEAIRRNDWEAVLRDSEPALSAPSVTTRALALSQRVRAFIALKRMSEAQTALDEMEKLDSTKREIYEFRATILEASGEVFEALSVLRSGIERYPADGIMRAHMLKLLHSMNAGDEQDEIVRGLMENPPDFPAGVITAYMALSDTKHDAEAMEFLGRARKRFPNSGELQLFEAVKKLEKGDYAGARAATKGLTGTAAQVAKKLRAAAWFMQIMDKLLFFLKKRKPGVQSGIE